MNLLLVEVFKENVLSEDLKCIVKLWWRL